MTSSQTSSPASVTDPNRAALEQIAADLGSLRDEVVFVGGATVGLLVTDPAAAPVRPTKDIDVIIEVSTRAEYDHRIREALLALGFKELFGENIPTCAWQKGEIRLDIMPTDEELLGFSNQWYEAAMDHAEWVSLTDQRIRVVAGPYFLATKLDAFRGRGKGDYLGSHDLEDIVAVVDGRPGIITELRTSEHSVREYVSETITQFLADPRFRNALPGHVIDPGREAIVLDRFQKIARLSSS